MSSRDPREPLDPQVKVLFDLLRPGRAERVLEAGPLREGMAALEALLAAGAPPVAKEEEIRLPGPDGEIRALVFHPETAGATPPVLVYLHGGGWVIMSPESHAKLAKQICVGAGVIVVSVDYRLAPEHPFPAPLDDCVAAMRFVRANAAALGGDPARVALGGDSAGGNLTAATTLRLLAAGEAPPRAALLVCPVTDCHLDTDSYRTFGPDDPVLDDAIMHFFRESYLSGRRRLYDDPLVSPLRAELSGFPPTCVVVGGIDPLRDDGTQLAARLREAGGDVTLLEYPGMPHIFMMFPGLDAGARAVGDICAFLRDALSTGACD